MSASEVHSPSRDAAVGKADLKLEVDIIPVSDVDRAKQFYQRLGWRFDSDVAPLGGLRIVRFTPPGSGCSVTFDQGLTAAAPGSARAGLIVSDITAAHDELAAWDGTWPPSFTIRAPSSTPRPATRRPWTSRALHPSPWTSPTEAGPPHETCSSPGSRRRQLWSTWSP